MRGNSACKTKNNFPPCPGCGAVVAPNVSMVGGASLTCPKCGHIVKGSNINDVKNKWGCGRV